MKRILDARTRGIDHAFLSVVPLFFAVPIWLGGFLAFPWLVAVIGAVLVLTAVLEFRYRRLIKGITSTAPISETEYQFPDVKDIYAASKADIQEARKKRRQDMVWMASYLLPAYGVTHLIVGSLGIQSVAGLQVLNKGLALALIAIGVTVLISRLALRYLKPRP